MPTTYKYAHELRIRDSLLQSRAGVRSSHSRVLLLAGDSYNGGRNAEKYKREARPEEIWVRSIAVAAASKNTAFRCEAS